MIIPEETGCTDPPATITSEQQRESRAADFTETLISTHKHTHTRK